jgi:hypothetical protein
MMVPCNKRGRILITIRCGFALREIPPNINEKDFDNLQDRFVPKTANISHALILLDTYFLLDGRNIGCPCPSLRGGKMANIPGLQPDIKYCPKCRADLRNVPRNKMKSRGYARKDGTVSEETHTYDCTKCGTRFEINQDR